MKALPRRFTSRCAVATAFYLHWMKIKVSSPACLSASFVCVYVCVHVHVCVCVFVCVHVHVCVCKCAFVCV